jgi:hypothetical protein
MAQIHVFDRDSLQPIPFATVAEFLNDVPTGRGVAADQNGIATFDGNLFDGNTLRVSAVGYLPQTFTYETLGGGENALTQILLYPFTVEIDTSIVETKKTKYFWLLTLLAVLVHYKIRR